MRVLLRLLLLGLALTMVGEGHARSQPAPADDKAAAARATHGDTDKAADAGNAAEADKAAEAADEDGAATKGTLIVKARTPKGAAIDESNVMIDNKPMGGLEDGEAIFENVPEGPHAIVIEASGYRRFEQAVAVRRGEQAKLEALLTVEPPPERLPHSPVWKWSLATGFVMMAVGGAFMYYHHDRMVRNIDAILVLPAENPDGSGRFPDPVRIQSGDCGNDAATIARQKHTVVVNQARFDRACTWLGRLAISGGVAGVGGLIAFASIVMLTRETGMAAPPTFSVRSNNMLAIVPTVTPDGVGASLSLTW